MKISADNALFFHGHDAETALADYIHGRREFNDVLKDYRRWHSRLKPLTVAVPIALPVCQRTKSAKQAM